MLLSILKLGSGNAVAVLLGAATTAMLVSVSSASSIGGLSLAFSAAAVITEILLLRMDVGVLKLSSEHQRWRLAGFGLLMIALGGTLLSLAAVSMARLELPLTAPVREQLIWCPGLALLLAVNRLLQGLHAARGDFGSSAIATSIAAVVTSFGALSMVLGLFPAQIPIHCFLAGALAGAMANLILARPLSALQAHSPESGHSGHALFHQQRKLAISTITNTLPTVVAAASVPWLLAAFYNAEAAGMFYLLSQLVVKPMALAAAATWSVVNANLERRAEPGARRDIICALHRGLSPAVLLAIPVLSLSIEPLTALIGGEWASVLRLLPLFGLMAGVNFLSNVSSYWTAYGYLRAEAGWNSGLLVGRFGALIAPALVLDSPETMLGTYALASSLLYASILSYWGRKLALGRYFSRSLLMAVTLGAICTGVGYGLLPQSLAVIALLLTLVLAISRYQHLEALKTLA